MHSTLPHPKSHPISARYVRVIEIFSTIFVLAKWSCWWNTLQPTVNAAGWGYDLCLSHLCPDPVYNSPVNHNLSRYDSMNKFVSSYAVIGSQRVTHEKYLGRLFVNRTGIADYRLMKRVIFPFLCCSLSSSSLQETRRVTG